MKVIYYQCTNCDQKLESYSSAIGYVVTCPTCNTIVEVPKRSAIKEPPPIPKDTIISKFKRWYLQKPKQANHLSNMFACNSFIGLTLFFGMASIQTFFPTSTKSTQHIVSKPRKPYVPINSSWDGSVLEVKWYLDKVLKDPDSFDAIEWSKVAKAYGNTYMVRCKYRAKNSFGGYVIANQVFTMTKIGKDYKVTNVTNW